MWYIHSITMRFMHAMVADCEEAMTLYFIVFLFQEGTNHPFNCNQLHKCCCFISTGASIFNTIIEFALQCAPHILRAGIVTNVYCYSFLSVQWLGLHTLICYVTHFWMVLTSMLINAVTYNTNTLLCIPCKMAITHYFTVLYLYWTFYHIKD